MMSRHIQSKHRCILLLLAPALWAISFTALLLTGPSPTFAQPGQNRFERPHDPADSTDPMALSETLMKHHREEAAAKTRMAKAWMGAQPAMTPNQSMYDVHYYDLDLDFAVVPSITQLTAQVGVLVEVTGDSIATLDLDLSNNLAVSAATAGGSSAVFAHTLDVLTISLDRTYVTGETVEVVVSYSGNPSGPSFGWDTYAGEDMIWTLSEPYGSHDWWPCKDQNKDKADSVDIRVTVPSNLIAVSQGKLLSNIYNGSSRTFHWRTNYPTNTYQVSLAIHPYTFFTDSYTPQGGGPPMEVQFYVFPDHYTSVQTNYAMTVPMMNVFAQGFGEYPFLSEKYGHAEFLGGGGMEHQTIASMGGWTEDVIAHELAHQWFGDYITCADFGHVWLNEGFATWCEAYWKEQTEGVASYRTYMEATSYYGAGTIFVEDPADFATIFSPGLSYNKASWVVHMLRGVLGDTDFFAGLAAYQALYGYGSATTEQFRDVMESVSGKDLHLFFNQWIYGEYYPTYDVTWAQIWSQTATTLNLTVKQVQTNTGLFTMPIQIRMVTATDTTNFTVDNSLAVENYSIPVTGTVLNVELDPDRWILRRIQNEIVNPTFDAGVLLVNGVSWAYDSDLTPAYQDSAFSGQREFSFWDVFDEPSGGYPTELPAPLGHGRVPSDILGQYSAIIWVSDSYQGDVPRWFDTSIYPYLNVGGNVLLMARRARSFFDDNLTNYLGVTWTQSATTLQDYTPDYSGLTNISFLGSQTWNDLFALTVGPQSTLLYQDSVINLGVGVHAQTPGGGTVRPSGAHFSLLCARPYLMDHIELRTNVEVILSDLFGEPQVIGVPESQGANVVKLLPSYPNPFGIQTAIPFSLPRAANVSLAIYDASGRRVRTLLEGEQPSGSQLVTWNGRDATGHVVASGIYFVRLDAGGVTSGRTVVLTK